MTIWNSIKNWFLERTTKPAGLHNLDPKALAAADAAFDRLVEKLKAYREFKICPSCRGTDILAGHSIKRGVEEVWCDECGFTVFADDPWKAMDLWNSQPRNPEQD